MTDELVRAAVVRAGRTAIEYVLGSIPAGLVITPVMLQNLDLKWCAYVAAAWFLTGALQCLAAFLAGIKTGLPEAEEDDDFDPTEEGDEDDDDSEEAES